MNEQQHLPGLSQGLSVLPPAFDATPRSVTGISAAKGANRVRMSSGENLSEMDGSFNG